jgi:hypothetical protein
MDDLRKRLDALRDDQVMAVLEAVTGELAGEDLPEGADEQADALAAALAGTGQELPVHEVADADARQAAQAARELLVLLADSPEAGPVVAEWVDEPPRQEAAALPLVLAAPLVLTGCVVLLQLVGHTTFRHEPGKGWSIEYDPAKRTPFDRTMTKMVGVLARMMGAGGADK